MYTKGLVEIPPQPGSLERTPTWLHEQPHQPEKVIYDINTWQNQNPGMGDPQGGWGGPLQVSPTPKLSAASLTPDSQRLA